MTSLDTWANSPMPMWSEGDDQTFKQKQEELMEVQEMYSQVPRAFSPKESNPLVNGSMYKDEAGKLVRGVMFASSAMDQAGAEDYKSGYLNQNTNSQKFAAQMMLNLESTGIDHEFLKYSDENKEKLKRFASQTGWNIYDQFAKLGTGDLSAVPGYSAYGAEAPEDLFEVEPPKGWSVDGAIEALRGDEFLYFSYAEALGGDQNLQEIVAGSRNQYEFFYKLGQARQMKAIQKSLAVFYDTASTSESVYETYIKGFVVNGIVNDPDMAGSMALSAGLTLAAGPFGAIAGGILMGVKLTKAGVKAKRRLALIDRLASIGTGLRNAQKFMPENIGPMLTSRLLKVNPTSSASRRITNSILGNAAEGAVSGAMADIVNQNKRINAKYQENYSISKTLSEAALEALISPAINPVMGGSMILVSNLGGQLTAPLAKLGVGITDGVGLKVVREHIATMARFTNPENVRDVARGLRLHGDIVTKMNQGMGREGAPDVTFDEADDTMTALVSTIEEYTTLSRDEIIRMLPDQLDRLSSTEGSNFGKMSEVELADELAMSMLGSMYNAGALTAEQMTNATNRVPLENRLKIKLQKLAREKGQTVSQVVEEIKENNDTFSLLDEETQATTKSEMGDDFAPKEGETAEQTDTRRVNAAGALVQQDQTNKAEDINEFIDEANKLASQNGKAPEAETNDVGGTTEALVKDSKDANTKDKAVVEKGTTTPENKTTFHERKNARKAKDRIQKRNKQVEKVKEKARAVEERSETTELRELRKELTRIKDALVRYDEELGKAGGSVMAAIRESMPKVRTTLENILSEKLEDGQEKDRLTDRKLNKIQIDSSKMSEEGKIALQELADAFEERGMEIPPIITKLLAGKTVSYGTIKSEFYGGMKEYEKSIFKKLRGLAAWGDYKREEKNLKNTFHKIEILRRKQFREMWTSKNRQFNAAQLFKTVNRIQKQDSVVLEAEKRAGEKLLEGKKRKGKIQIRLDELMQVLPKRSKRYQQERNALDKMNAEERAKYKAEKTFSFEEAKSILDSAYDSAKRRIANFSVNHNRLMPELIVGTSQTYLEDADPRQLATSIILTPQERLDASDIGTPLHESGGETASSVNSDRSVEDEVEAKRKIARTENREQNLDAVVQEIKANKERIKLVEDEETGESYYIDTQNNNERYERVSAVVKGETEADLSDRSGLLRSAIDLGNKVDILIRDFFENDGDINLEDYYITDKPKDLENFVKRLRVLKQEMEARGEVVLANDIVAFDAKNKVAGTLDLLTYDREGNFRIYDVKTMRGDQFRNFYANDPTGVMYSSTKFSEKSRQQQHIEQLSLYRMLLFNTHGILSTENTIIPVELSYGPGSKRTKVLRMLEEGRHKLEIKDEVGRVKLDPLKEAWDIDSGESFDEEGARAAAQAKVMVPTKAAEQFAYTLEEDIRFWAEFEANLENIAASPEILNPDGSIDAAVLWAAMPEYWWNFGLGLHVLFKNAIVNPVNTRDGGVENFANIEMIRFDLSIVRQEMNIIKERATYVLKDWGKQVTTDIVTVMERNLNDPANRDGVANIHDSLIFVRSLQDSVKRIHLKMFDDNGGYPIGTDKNGYPKYYTKNENDYTDGVLAAIKQRLYLYERRNKTAYLQKFAEFFSDYTGGDRDYFNRGDKNELRDTISWFVDNKLQSLLAEVDPDLVLENFGNGKFDYMSSDLAGKAIVDYIVGKQLPTRRVLVAKRDEFGNITRTVGTEAAGPADGKAVQVSSPMEGDLNAVMPYPLWNVGSLWNDTRMRNRVRRVLNTTPEELARYEAWREKQDKEIDADPTGKTAPFRLLPNLAEGSLFRTMMTRKELKEALIHNMFGIARQSESLIQDQRAFARGVPLRFRTDMGFAPIGTGDPLVLPFNRITENVAVEMMSPDGFQGFTVASIEATQRAKRVAQAEWEEDNPGLTWDPKTFWETQNTSDRSASVAQELKLLYLASDPDAEVTWKTTDGKTRKGTAQQLIKEIRNGTAEMVGKDDFYATAGFRLVKGILDSKDSETKRKMGPLLTFFKETLDSVESIEQMNAIIESGSRQGKKLKILRKMFKSTVMTRFYMAGRTTYNKEFNEPTSKTRRAMDLIFKDEAEITSEMLNALGDMLYGSEQSHLAPMIDTALAFGTGTTLKKMREKALSLLTTNTTANYSSWWRDTLNALSLTEEDGVDNGIDMKKMGKRFTSMQFKKDLIEANIKRFADITGMTEEQIREQEADRINNAHEFLRQHGDFAVGSDLWAEFTQILNPTDKMSSSVNGFMGILNAVNSSAYSLAKERMATVAERHGIENYTEQDLIGWEDEILYHTLRPTATSYRGYYDKSETGFNPAGAKWERVANNIEVNIEVGGVAGRYTYENYIAARVQEKGGTATTEELMEYTEAFLLADEDAVEAFGSQDLVEDPILKYIPEFDKMTKAEQDAAIDAKVDELMMKQEMLLFAEQAELPSEVYDRGPEELFFEAGNTDQMLADWSSRTRQREASLKKEQEREAQMLDKKQMELLEQKAKHSGLVNKDVAKETGFRLRAQEQVESEIPLGGRQQLHTVDTSNPRGPMGIAPEYAGVNFYNKGSFGLMRKGLERRKKELMGSVQRYAEINESVEGGLTVEGMLGGEARRHEAFGWMSPWDKGNLPRVRPVTTREFDYGVDDTGQKTAVLYQEISNWAEDHGLKEELDANPELFPYFHVIMLIENDRQVIIDKMKAQTSREFNHNTGETSDELAEEMQYYRNEFLELMFLHSQLMRDIKNRARDARRFESKDKPLPLYRGLREGETVRDYLTSIRSESNPDGAMMMRTLLHREMGLIVPGENITLMVDGKPVEGAMISSEPTIKARMIQASDLMKMIASSGLNVYIGETLRDHEPSPGVFPFREVKDGIPLWQQVSRYEELLTGDLDFMTTILNDLLARVQGLDKQLEFDVQIVEQIASDKKAADTLKLSLGDRSQQRLPGDSQRNQLAASMPGMHIMVQGNTQIKGENITLGISLEAAVNMFVMLGNVNLIDRVRAATHMNVSWGLKMGENGRIEAKPIQEIIQDALGFSARPVRVAMQEKTEIMARLMGGLGGAVTVTETGDKKIGGRAIELIDLDHYSEARDDIGMGVAWLESAISPIQKLITTMERENLPETDGVVNLKELIELARSGDLAAEAEIMYLGVMIQAEGTYIEADVFIDAERYKDVMGSAKTRARQRYNQLQILRQSKLSNENAPFYWYAREFMMSSKYDGTFAGFRGYLSEIGMYLSDEDLLYYGLKDIDESKREELFEFIVKRAYDLATVDDISEARDFRYVRKFENEANDNLNIDLENARYSREQMSTLADRVGEPGRENLHRLNDNIERGIQEGVIREEQAAMLRAIAIRAYQLNPVLLEGLTFDILVDGITERGFAEAKNGKFRIGFNRKRADRDSLDVPLLFAHEMSHIARMKFLSEDSLEYRNFLTLHDQEKQGRTSFLKKLVMAWHGGKFTQEARKEYEMYMNDPEEFIAALGQYYLINDSLPDISGLTVGEAKFGEAADGIIARIFSYASRIFRRLSSTFAALEKEDPEMFEVLNASLMRMFGRTPQGEQINGAMHSIEDQMYYWEKQFGESQAVEFAEPDSEFAGHLEKYDEYSSLIDRGVELTPEEAEEFRQLTLHVKDPDGEGQKITGIFGNTKEVMTRSYLLAVKIYGRKLPTGSIQIDIEKMLNNGATGSDKTTTNHMIQAVMEKVLVDLEKTYGDPIRQGLAKGGSKVLSVIDTATGMNKNNDNSGVSSMLIGLLAGQTGANSLWASESLAVVMMSTMLDDNVTHTLGKYTNVQGLPSVVRVIKEISIYTDIIINGQNRIKEIKGAKDPVIEKEINKQILMAVDSRNFNYNFNETLGDFYNNLSPKKQTELKTEMTRVAKAFRAALDDQTEKGKQIGEYSAEFEMGTPITLQNVNNTSIESGNFVDLFGSMITDRILSEADMVRGKIDPLTMLAMGIIPRTHNRDLMLEDLENLTNGARSFVLSSVQQELNPAIRLNEEQLMKNIREDSRDGEYSRAVIMAVSKMVKGMAHGKITFGDLGPFFPDGQMNIFIDNYKKAVTSDAHAQKLNDMQVDGINQFFPQSMVYIRQEGRNPIREVVIKNASSMHVHNIVNRSFGRQYFPHDSWVAPRASEIAQVPELADHVVLSPRVLADGFKKELADEVGEKTMISESFGVIANSRNLIKLFTRAVTTGTNMRHHDGTPIQGKTKRHLIESGNLLMEKANAIRGIVKTKENVTEIETALMNALPDITRLVYGGNLTMATLIVEGISNVGMEVLGRGNIVGAIRGIIAPFTFLNPSLRKEMQEEMIQITEALAQGHIPDNERPSTEAEMAFRQKLYANTIGLGADHSMRLASGLIRNLAFSRAVQARAFVSKNLKNGKLYKLAQLIKAERLENENIFASDPKKLKGLMREAKLSPYAHLGLVRSLLNGGLFDDGKLAAMTEMVTEDLNTSGRGYYSPQRMAHSILQTYSGADAEYRTRMEAIQALKTYEKQYIEEIMVSPNPFDQATSGGFWARMIEVFRRYPTLFVTNHVIRKSNTMSPAKFSLNLVTMLTLDMVYMTMLRIAAGNPYEEVLKDLEDNKSEAALHYMSRLPIMGRYLGFIMTAISTTIQGRGTDFGIDLIPLAAAQTAVSNVVKMGKSQIAQEDHKWQDTINALRIIPYIGDTLVRAGVYTAMGTSIERRPYRSQFGKTNSTKTKNPYGSNYGMRMSDAAFQYEHLMGNLIEEIAPDFSFPSYERAQPGLGSFGLSEPTPSQPQLPSAAPEPVQAPQTAPKESIGAEDLIAANKPIQAPDALLN